MDAFSCSPLSTTFYIEKKTHKKGFQKILNSLICDMVTSFKHDNDITDQPATSLLPTCGCSFFIFPMGWYGYVRKNYLTWVKTTEILIWSARKIDISPLYIDYCSNKTIKEIGEKQLFNFLQSWGQNSPLMHKHVALCVFRGGGGGVFLKNKISAHLNNKIITLKAPPIICSR